MAIIVTINAGKVRIDLNVISNWNNELVDIRLWVTCVFNHMTFSQFVEIPFHNSIHRTTFFIYKYLDYRVGNRSPGLNKNPLILHPSIKE
jgi:hypothetical protein